MNWTVKFHDEFEAEFEDMPELLQDELLARLRVIEHWGPDLGRPHVDTLKGSNFANMKELRFGFDGVFGGSDLLLIRREGQSFW